MIDDSAMDDFGKSSDSSQMTDITSIPSSDNSITDVSDDDGECSISESKKSVRFSSVYIREYNVIEEVCADNDDDTKQLHKTTALFFHIPRSGSGSIKQLYQSCSTVNDMTIATAHTKGGIARAVDLELVYRSSPSQQQDYDSNSDSLPDNNANAETTTTTSYKADILFTTGKLFHVGIKHYIICAFIQPALTLYI